MTAPITIIIPTLNSEKSLPPTLYPLVNGVISGLVHKVIIVDGGSEDATKRIAEDTGCYILNADKGRGNQLSQGARIAQTSWLLFLHSDTILCDDWHEIASHHIKQISHNQKQQAAYFKFQLNTKGIRPRLLETMVALRCWIFALPYGDQGLLISQSLYDDIGGYTKLPLMEDVDIIRRIGRKRLCMLNCTARTSADRYEKSGYLWRSLRNLSYLLRYFLGASPEKILQSYTK